MTTPVWQLFVSGAAGSSITFAVTWWRERRRTKDAYHAPQRDAIGDIVTATATVMLTELESRTYLSGLLERHRTGQPGHPDFDETKTPTAALAKATLDAERAFQVGSLNIVDAPCFEAFGTAYVELTLLRKAMADTTGFSTEQHIEQYVTAIQGLSANLSTAVISLVNVANQRITPAETIWNRRNRKKARQRLGQRHSLSLLTNGGES
ncbi:hypothetical protein A5656_19655 [Mycobacterium gordonae]|nr:hypothetical protein [Mycobacterium gordonae]OBK56316.1 hypothetical protein A5656_19655 [Mycobacterium gordonae]